MQHWSEIYHILIKLIEIIIYQSHCRQLIGGFHYLMSFLGSIGKLMAACFKVNKLVYIASCT